MTIKKLLKIMHLLIIILKHSSVNLPVNIKTTIFLILLKYGKVRKKSKDFDPCFSLFLNSTRCVL